MTTVKTTVKKTVAPKKRTKLQEAEFQNMILTEALYMQYNDFDELHNLLACVIKSLDAEGASIYQTKHALQAFRSLIIHQQTMMMDCAGLEY